MSKLKYTYIVFLYTGVLTDRSEKVGVSEWLTVMLLVHTKLVKTKLL